MRKKFIIFILFLLLSCSTCYAGNVYGQHFTEHVGNTNIKMLDGVDGNRYEVHQSNKNINIKLKEQKTFDRLIRKDDSKYHKQRVQIPFEEIERLDDFNGVIKIKHYDDMGANDWNKVVPAVNNNGFVYLDLEFSEVIIEGNVYELPSNWGSNTSIVSGLGTIYNTAPCVFDINDTYYLIDGNFIGQFTGFKWNGTGWDSNTSIVSGLGDIGYLATPETFENGSDLFLISGDAGGTFTGFKWNGTGWDSNTSIVSGLGDVGDYSSPAVFNSESGTFLISGNQTGGFSGFEWNGTGWATNDSIVSGLIQVSLFSSPCVFNYSGERYLITGNASGDFDGYISIDGNWTYDDKIVAGIQNNGGSSRPEIFNMGDETFLISGENTYSTFHGFKAGTYLDIVSPLSGETIYIPFPPITQNVIFKIDDPPETSYNINIYSDVTKSTLINSKSFSTNETTIPLKADQYYWEIEYTYNSTEYTSDLFNFSLEYNSTRTGTGVEGVVYDIATDLSISNAIVTVGNDTWTSTPYVTSANGYFYFDGLSNTSNYVMSAAKSGYMSSSIYFLPVTDEMQIHNIPMTEEEGAGIYYEKHYVRFIVTDKGLSQTYSANIKVYVGNSADLLYEQNTGDDGAAGFWLDQKTQYRFVTTYDGQSQTDYITPTNVKYNIFLEWIDTEKTFLPTTQFYDDVNITVTKNDDTGQVSVYYNDSLLETNSLKFQIGQTNNSGTFVLISESPEYVDTNVQSYTFTLTEYVGEDYQVRVIIDHDSFGAVTKSYGVSFPGSNLPFGRGIAYLCVFVLLIAGMQFSANDANSGAILICGMASIMWYMDIFAVFGSTVNTLMGTGLGMAILYAILKYINDKRMAEGL